jgi:Lrp/AsnC family transcriptional regulator, regulator for asnA, asnC and gidA
MDELDLLILNALQEDGRMPFTQIAKRAGVAESTIRNRYTSLVERGIIQTVSIIDPFALGYKAPALIGINVSSGDVERVAQAIKKIPEVSYLVLTLGGYDLVVEVFCRDVAHLTELITNQIQAIPGIQTTETLVVGKIYKLSFFWSPEPDQMETDN